MPEAEVQAGPEFMVWPFEAGAWSRIQAAVGHPAEGDILAIWAWINQGLLFTTMEQQRKLLPSLKEIRLGKQELLDVVDSLIEKLGINPSLSEEQPFELDATAFSWLMGGALQKMHPAGRQLSENSRQDAKSVSEAHDILREDYDGVQLHAQTQVMSLFEQLNSQLGLLRELTAQSLIETSSKEARGSGRDLARATFVKYTAHAYEVAYRRPARPGRKGADDEAGPAVRFIMTVASEARRSDLVVQRYRPLLRDGLHVTSNSVRRLLIKRQGR